MKFVLFNEKENVEFGVDVLLDENFIKEVWYYNNIIVGFLKDFNNMVL